MTKLANNFLCSRRTLFQVATGSLFLQACASKELKPVSNNIPTTPKRTLPIVKLDSYNTVHIFASSGFASDARRITWGAERLSLAGLSVNNLNAAYRRFQRFAGTEQERVNDLLEVATGRIPTPKVLMGLRGGYGAIHLLPHIDWQTLGDRMRECNTLLLGFSDVCAIQLALLAKSGMPSFAGPMLYSEFGKEFPSEFTMQKFVDTVSNSSISIDVPTMTSQHLNMEGIFWGGNLSVLVSLIGTPYFPDIDGGILFLEDVGEQPYRIERMFQQLYLSGCLKKQRAIVLGNFRMGSGTTDTYDASYNLTTVIASLRRLTGLPILTDFPFGHITNKVCVPLGSVCRLHSDGISYRISFDNYPKLEADKLSLNRLIPSQNALIEQRLAEEAAAAEAVSNSDSIGQFIQNNISSEQ